MQDGLTRLPTRLQMGFFVFPLEDFKVCLIML